MSCSCKSTPKPPQPNQKTFLDIVKGNSVTPPNGTYEMIVQVRIDNLIYNGTGLLTYTSNPDGSIDHYFQTNLNSPNAPFIEPLTGKGFLNLYEYQSHHNSHHFIHSYITNKLNIYHQDLHIHINAQPASCSCNKNNCKGSSFCGSCNSCQKIISAIF
jgi:hypothetical protein